MRQFIIITVSIILVIAEALAYPIRPRPLRKLVLESEFIVVGFVQETKPIEHASFGNTVARVEVIDVIQGEIEEKVIEILYSPDMVCPSPARYFDSTLVITFLDKDKEGIYRTHALSYGSKTLNQQGIEVFMKRILEMQNILQVKDVEMRRRHTLDWLVRCAENEHTRWDGLYELSPGSHLMSAYDHEGKQEYGALTLEHTERLAHSLFQTSKLNYSDLGIIELIKGYSDERLLNYLCFQLRLMEEADLWYADKMMTPIMELSDNPSLGKYYMLFREINSFDSDKVKEQKRILDSFVAAIGS